MLADENGVTLVLLDLPAVLRMDLLDVDDDEFDLIAEARVDAIEGPSLGPKRWSRVAAEDERYRPLAAQRRERKALGLAIRPLAQPRQLGCAMAAARSSVFMPSRFICPGSPTRSRMFSISFCVSTFAIGGPFSCSARVPRAPQRQPRQADAER